MNALKPRKSIYLALGALALLAAGCGGSPPPQQVADSLTATLSELQGLVQTLKPAQAEFKDAFNGQVLESNDQVITYEESRARVDLSNGTIVRVGPLSTFILEQAETRADGPFARLKLEVGKLWIILNGGSIDIDTPSGLASVRGSFMHVWVLRGSNEVVVTCLEGACEVGNGEGSVMLSAGQDAHISDLDSPPVQGTMTHEDISEWLAINPEATEVIEPLTPTSTQSASNALSTPTPTFSNQVASTGTSASFECGPPDGWVIYVVKAEDTLAKIAGAYGVSVADLQRANCLGNSTALFTGMNIFVPNTPTRTPTATTTGTVTLLPTATSTTVAISPTATCTPIVQPSPTPTSTPDKRTVFSNPEGPDNCATILTCANSYSVNVTDLDGVSWVKMEYSVNSASFSGTEYFLLTQSGETWSGTITVDTSLPGTDTVYWRFWAGDGLSNESYYPASGSYFYTDPLDCF